MSTHQKASAIGRPQWIGEEGEGGLSWIVERKTADWAPTHTSEIYFERPMGRSRHLTGRHLTGKLEGERAILSRSEVLQILSEMH